MTATLFLQLFCSGVGSSEYLSPGLWPFYLNISGLPDLALTSTIQFIFHFLIMFLTVEIGSLSLSFSVAASFFVEMKHFHSEILGQLFRETHGC